MTSLAVTSDQVDTFARSLDDLVDDLDNLDQVNVEVAAQVIAAVDAPRRTGRLAATVAASVDPAGVTLTAGGTSAPYAPYVHARNPFLVNAITDQERQIVEAYAEHIATALTRIPGA